LRGRNLKGAGLDTTKAIELSFVSGNPCALATWGFTPQLEDIPSPPQGQQTAPLRGTFIGCEDGSVYLFHPKLGAKADLISPAQFTFELADTLLHTRPSTPSVISHLGLNPSAFSSQSSLKSTTNPFHLSRSRIVSGVTTEAVEAPKNHVDFEDEQEKLKGLLSQRSPVKERHLTDGVFPPFEKNISIDKHPIQPLATTTAETLSRKPTKKKSEIRVHSSTHSRTPSYPMNSSFYAQTSPAITLLQLYILPETSTRFASTHTYISVTFRPREERFLNYVVDESQRYAVVSPRERVYISTVYSRYGSD
jgi:hypothetical protein